MAHLHSIYDSDLHFKIDPITREITNQSANKATLIQFDHNSERFTFEIPQRYIEGHDMSLCDRVEVHYLNANAVTKEQYSGVYEVEDLQISPNGEDVVICSWLVSRNATSIAGTLNFVIRFACTGDDYVWNTAIFKGINVSNGLYNSESIIEEYADVLEQWRLSLFTASDNGVTNIGEAKVAALDEIEATTGNQIAAIEQKKDEVLTSLPDDYISLSENVAPAIVEAVSGVAVAVSDSANRKLRGLSLYGKSTQDGTPTPEAPVEIVSVDNPTVRVCGKNLLPATYKNGFSKTHGGLTYTVNGDGSVHVVGTVTSVESYFILTDFNFGEKSVGMGKSNGVYVWSDCLYNATNHYTILYFSQGNVVDKTYYPQVEIGTVATAYEQPKGRDYVIPRSLPGIPVSSGGNYTDENGQQWICDEVDFERGVYVQRVGNETKTLVFEEEDTLGRFISAKSLEYYYKSGINPCLCNIAEWSSSATLHKHCCVGASRLYYKDDDKTLEEINALFSDKEVQIVGILVSPIETPLTSEELEAYASLRSNYPNTSVLNDGGAGMAVKYVADTKLYIDKKLSI